MMYCNLMDIGPKPSALKGKEKEVKFSPGLGDDKDGGLGQQCAASTGGV